MRREEKRNVATDEPCHGKWRDYNFQGKERPRTSLLLQSVLLSSFPTLSGSSSIQSQCHSTDADFATSCKARASTGSH